MNILETLSRTVETHAPGEVLDLAGEAIAKEMGCEACSILVRDWGSARLLQRSAFGKIWGDDAARSAGETAAAQALVAMGPVVVEALSCLFIAVPMVEYGRPIGAVVVIARRALTTEQRRTLVAVAAQMVGIIESARFVEAVDGAVAVQDFDGRSVESLGELDGELVLQGTAASSGIGMGAAVFRRAFPRELARRESLAGDKDSERRRMRDAFEKTRNDIARIQSAALSELGEDQALIFSSHLMLLNDPVLNARIEEGIASGSTAAGAIVAAIDEFERRLRGVRDPYLRERVEDLEDLCSRVLGYLIVVHPRGALGGQVVLSPRLAPSLIMELKTRGAAGIVAEAGGATSHGALLARSLGVPAVTGVPSLMRSVRVGDAMIVDGTNGQVIIRPTEETLEEYRRRTRDEERLRTEFARYRDRVPETADGVRVGLQANVAMGIDIVLAKENGAEGIGLYRTEFPFIVREGFPTRDEQVDIYRKAYASFPDGPIAFRILDLAGDKFVPTSHVASAESAFHGYRSIRVLFDYPHVLRDQIQAFAIAAGERPLRILVPMVSSLEDLARVKAIAADALSELSGPGVQRRPRWGAMIEIPAAIELAAEIAAEVDFLSIGTNDLIQYTLVIDREDARMASLRNAYHPALLRMIRRTILAAHACGKEVGVCGEMAARPDLAVLLVALGVDSLSVAPRVVPEIKQALAGARVKPLVAAANRLLACRDSTEIELMLKLNLGAAG